MMMKWKPGGSTHFPLGEDAEEVLNSTNAIKVEVRRSYETVVGKIFQGS